MQKQTIKCAFCRGTGNNPHFIGTCPVCKGKGENYVHGKYMFCTECRGSGQKKGTTLTCYTCGGLGIVPDIREDIKKARKEIIQAREEIERNTGRRRETNDPRNSVRKEFQEKINKLKEVNERLYRKLRVAKNRNEKNNTSKDKKGIARAIAVFCGDCPMGEEKQCSDIRCPLALYSPVAAGINS